MSPNRHLTGTRPAGRLHSSDVLRCAIYVMTESGDYSMTPKKYGDGALVGHVTTQGVLLS